MVSYCAYLVHMALILVMPSLYALPLTLLIATASWYGFERPINDLKDRFTRSTDGKGGPTLVAGLVETPA